MALKKILISGFVIVSVLFCFVSVRAKTIDKVELNQDGILTVSGRIKISGTNFVEEAESGMLNEFPPKVTFIILNPGYSESDLENIDINDISEVINHISGITTETDGTYKYSTKIQGETGQYTIIASSRFVQTPYKQTFQYVNKMLEDLNNIKNTAAISDLKKFIENESASLKLNMFGYILLKNNGYEDYVIDKIKQSDDFASLNELGILFDSLIKNAMFNQIDDANTLWSYVKNKYSETPVIEFLNNNCSDELKLNIISGFLHKETDDEIFIKNIADKTLIGYLKSIQYWKEIQVVFDSKAFEFDEASMSEFKKLKNQDEVLKVMYKSIDGTETSADVKKLFEDAVKEQKKSESEKKKDSGSSSSGSSGGGKSIVSVGYEPAHVDTEDVQIEIEKCLFNDLEQVPWAKDMIIELANAKIVNGISDGYFEPERMIKREEFIQICMKGLRLTGIGQNVEFDDVNENDWFYPAVAAAYNNKIIKGNDKGLFGTGEYITRQDAAVILYRCAETINVSFPTVNGARFDDETEISDYAKKSIDILSSVGIINGMPDGCFMPKNSLTRAEGAKLVHTFLKYGKLL